MANNGAYIEIDGEKQYISRELRFLHHSEPFETRDEAKAYVDEQIAAENINNDYAQPIVVRYIDEGGEQIILGIGKGDNGYHFIDSAAIEHDLKAIIASIGTGDEGADLVYSEEKLLSVKDQLYAINQTIQNGDEEISFDPDHTIAAKIDEILSFISHAAESIGLNADGTLSEYESTEYISDGESLKQAVETLDESLADVQRQVTTNKVASADNTIVVVSDETGTDLSVNVDKKTIVVDDNGTILSGLRIEKYDEDDNIGSDILAVYKLVDKNGTPIEGSKPIEVPKDRSLYDVRLGDMGDEFNRPYEGDKYKTLFPDDIKSGTSSTEALRFIYQLSDGVFQMALIDLESFIHEAEFKDGLTVNGHEVSVKLDKTAGSDSEKFLDFVEVPGENAAIGLHGITEAIAVETARAEAQEDKIEENVGLAADGSHVPTEGHYTAEATTIAGEIAALDAEAFRHSGETDAVEEAVGLDENGHHIATEGHYTSSANTIAEEIAALDAEAFRHSGETDAVEASVGLNADGEYVPYSEGTYTSGATTVLEATKMLDDAVKDIQQEVTSITVVGEDAIKVHTEETGSTISLKISDADKLLTNDNDGLHTTIDLVQVTGQELRDLGADVKEAYKLTGVGSERIGDYIKIYKNSVIYRIAVGDMGDKFINFEPGSAGMITSNPTEENIAAGTTQKEAIRVIYDLGRVNAVGLELYEMLLIDVDSFLQLDEFKDGLEVVQGETSKVVKVKIDPESEGFLTVSINGVKLSGVQDAINIERDRAIAEENRIEEGVGLTADGEYIKKEGTAYLDEANSVEEEIAALDAAMKSNKVYGDKAIKVETDENGTTVSLKVGDGDKLLTNDNDGLHTTIDLVEVTGEELAALGDDVKQAYKLTGVDDLQIGEYVKVYKDSAVYSIAIGDMGDEFKHPYEGNPMVTKFPEDSNIQPGTTGEEALRVIYRREDGLYEMKLINLDQFIQLDEFEDGLEIDGNVVKVKIDEASEAFLTVSIDGVKLSGVQDAINVERDRALAEENRIESGVGLDANGNYVKKHGSNYLDEANSVEDEIAILDAEAARHSGETDNVESSVGLADNGDYVAYTQGVYTSGATSVLEATSTLDDAVKNVQSQITSNKVYGEDAIVVETEATGTTVSLKLIEDGILANTEDGLFATMNVKALTAAEIAELEGGSNIKEAYKLVGKDNTTAFGDIIKIYKDQSLYSVKLGDMGDYFINNIGGDRYTTEFPDESNIMTGSTGSEALRLIYHLENGYYNMTLIDLETFLQESEFKDGLRVNGHEVSVKLDVTPGSDSEKFLDFVEVSGENSAIGLHGITEAIAVETNRATAEENAIEGGVGLAADGSHVPTEGHYTADAATIAGEIAALDAEAFRHSGETDTIESSVGLNADGSHKVTSGHYTSSAQTIAGEIAALDSEAFRNSGETDAIETGVGLAADGSYIQKTNSNYLNNATSVEGEIAALDAEAARHSGETDTIESSVGLDADGNYEAYEDGVYTSGATTVLAATSMLDDAVRDVQAQITGNKVYGEDAIKVNTVASGTTVSLQLENDGILSNTEDGLSATLSIAALTAAEISELPDGENVREAYKLVGLDGVSEFGRIIKVYKDSTLYSVELGDMGDEFKDGIDGDHSRTHSPIESNIDHGQTGEEAIRFIYQVSDGTYKMSLVNVDIFVQESEFKDGLVVANHEIKVKLDNEGDSARFLYMKEIPGENGAVALSGITEAIAVETARAEAQEDVIESNVGLASDGSHVPTEGHYTSGASTIAEEIAALDAEAFRHSNETDTVEASVGLDDNGGYITKVDTNYLNEATSIEDEIAALDAEAGRHSGETNTIESSVGLDTNGDYISKVGSNYLDDATSIEGEITALDVQAKFNQLETNRIEDGVGLDANGRHVRTTGNYTSGATSIAGEIAALDREAFRNSGETDTIEAAVGLNADGTHIATSGNYTSGATTIAQEIAALDAEAFRHSGETNAIEVAAGFNENGYYVPYVDGTYTSGVTSVLGATSRLDDAIKGVQEQVTGNKVYGDKAIVVTAESTGTTVGLQLHEDNILTNDTTGLYATLNIKSLTPEEIALLTDGGNVREAYKLVGVDGTTAFGDVIKVYKDVALYSVAVGDMGDYFNDAISGDKYTTQFPDEGNIIHGETHEEALRFIYQLQNGLYHMTLISVESFLQESEFKDGLVVAGHEVRVKLDTTPGSDSEKFLSFIQITGENAAIGLHGITEAIGVETARAEAQEDVIEANVGLAADGSHIESNGHYTSGATTVEAEIAKLDTEAYRHSGETDTIEASVGLDANGGYVAYTNGSYISGATTVLAADSALDDALVDVQEQVTANKVYGDKAIKVNTVNSGTTVSLEIKNDGILSNTDEGLFATLAITALTQAEIAELSDGKNVREAYKLVGIDGETKYGDIIKVYKDSSLYSVALGDMGDLFKDGIDGDYTRTTNPVDSNINHGQTGEEALRFIYLVSDGTYKMFLLSVESFLQESEFKDGLNIDGHEVSVKLDNEGDSARFLYMKEIPGENGAVALSGITEAIAVETSRATAEENAIEGGVGLAADGSHVTTTGHYTSSATTIAEEIAALDEEAFRNSGETDAIEAGVGLNEDGSYAAYEEGAYTSSATSTLDATSKLDDALLDIQEQVTANKVYGDKAIVVNTEDSGTTVALNLKDSTILTNTNAGLGATVNVVKLSVAEIAELSDAENVKEAYKVVGVDGTTAFGDIIKVYKDTSLYSVVLGDMGDYFNDAFGGDKYTTQYPGDDNIVEGQTGEEALRFIYQLQNGLYHMTLISIESFLQESEFKDGLTVVGHEVSVKLDTTPGSDSDKFLGFKTISGENAAIELHGITEAIGVETSRAEAQEDVIEANVGLAADGSHIRTSGNYTSGASTITGEIAALDTQAKSNQDETNTIEDEVGLSQSGRHVPTSGHYTYDASTVVGEIAKLDSEAYRHSGETDNIETAVGLTQDGLHIQTGGHYTASATTIAGEIAALDDEAFRNSGETNAIETGVGLASDGTYIEKEGTNYLDNATSVEGEIALLDAEAFRNSGETDAIEAGVGLDADGHHVATSGFYTSSAETIAQEIAALDAEAHRHSGETDTIETAVGLAQDGTFVPKTGTNYLDNARSIEEEILILDAMAGGSSGTEGVIINAVGLNSNGTYKPKTDSNYLNDATTVEGEIGALDIQAKSNQDETDSIETAVGLDSNGNYVSTAGEFTSAAESVMEAIMLLDTQASSCQDELDATQVGVGLNEDGGYVRTSDRFTSGATSVVGAIKALNDHASSNQDELDNVEANVGLASDGNYVAYTGGTYTSGATSVLDATSKLDDAIKDVQSQITENKIFGENAIEVSSDPTGTTISLNLANENILTNNESGLSATLNIKKLSAAEIADLSDGSNVREAYKLVGVDDSTAFGEVIKVYKDQTLYAVGLGDMGDYFNSPYEGDNYKSLYPDSIVSGQTGEEALRFIYQLSNGVYQMALVSLESFLQESEFKDGLTVNANHEVSVKLDNTYGSDSAKFLYLKTVEGETKSIALSGITEAIAVETNRASGQEDVIEANVGLNSDGTHKQTVGHYTSSATTIAGEIAALDAQAYSNQNETDAIETGVGLNADGSHYRTNGHYTSSATTIAGEIAALDEEAYRHSGETDAIETAVGLEENGRYIKPIGKFVSGSTNVREALEMLDSQADSNQSETDAIETALNLNTDGTYKATTTRYSSGATDMRAAIEAIDRQSASAQDEIDQVETGVGLASDGSYVAPAGAAYVSGTTSVMNAIQALNNQAFSNQGETDTVESAVGLNENGTHKNTNGNYTAGASTIAAEIAALDAEAYRHSGETDNIETGVGLDANGRYIRKVSSNYLNNATSVEEEISALDVQAKANQNETDAVEVGVGLNADGTHKESNGKYTSTATTIAGEIAALDAEAYRHSGETDAIETAVGLNNDGTYRQTRTTYTSGTSSVYAAIEALDTQAVSNQSETDVVEVGVGLNPNGEYVRTSDRFTSGASTVVGAIKALNDQASSNQDEVDTIESGVGLNADGSHKGTTGHYTSSASTIAAEIAALDNEAYRNSGETDNIETAVGLAQDGTYRQTSTRYTSAQTSVFNSIEALDRQAASSQDELDAAEAALDLNADGTYKRTNDRFTSGATTMAGAIKALNDQALANQNELDTAEGGVGLAADGTYIVKTASYYLNSATSIESEIAALDSEAARHSGETDTIETAVGLSENGSYVRPNGKYVSGSTSVMSAIELLNLQAVDNQGETDTVEASVGLNADGTHKATTGYYTSTATTITAEIAALDAEAFRHSGETDTIEAAVGLNADGSYIEPNGQYISGTSTVMAAIKNLNNQAVNNQAETDAIESGAGLAADGSHIQTQGHYTSNANSLAGEISALDAEAYRNAGEHGTIRTAVGLASDGSYIPTQDRFTSGATDVMGAIALAVHQIDANTVELETFGEDILKNRVESGSGAIDVDHTDTTENGTKVSLTINSLDNVLTQDNGLLATIHLTKATGITTGGTAYNCIRLIGRNNIILDEINTDDFVKDGFLENVQIVTRGGKNYLVFTWNTSAGSQVTEIDATELVKPYTASSGVTLDANNNFSGVVDPTSDSYFTVGADGFKLTGVKTAVDTINSLISQLRSEFDAERTRSIAKDGEQDTRLANAENNIQDNTDNIQDLTERLDNLILDSNDKLSDIYTENGGIEIYNADVGGKKYRRLKFKIGSTLDTTEEELPEINYLRIVTEKDASGNYTPNSGLHTTIRPITDDELSGIMNLSNIQ